MKSLVSLLQFLVESPVVTFSTVMTLILIVFWFVFWMTRKMTKLSISQKGLENNYNIVLQSVYRLSDKIDNLSEKMDEQFAQVNRRVDELDRKFETKINELDRKFETKIDELDRKFETKIDELDRKFETKTDDLSEQQHQNTLEVRSDIAYIMGELKGMENSKSQHKYNELRLKFARR